MKILLIIMLFTSLCFSQYTKETVSFVDTTTSALIDAPKNTYLAGIAKPDSGGLIITFEVEVDVDSTDQYVLLTALADSAYTITLPDSTSCYTISLPKDIFDPWRYYRIVFPAVTSCDLTVIWKNK